MNRRLAVVCASLLVAGAALAEAPEVDGPGVGNTEAAAVALATGADSGADGFLSIEVDEYGSWGDFGGVGLADSFNPVGPETALPVAFTAGFFFFVPDRGQQEALTTIPDWLAVYVDNTDTSIAITSPNVASDSNSDGVDDTASSSFSVTGGGTDLSVDLTQVVSSLGGGVAQIEQTYSITNNEAAPITIELVRSFDGDLLFDGDFTSDEVGTTANGAGGDTFVFMQEVGSPGTAVTVSGGANAYYGGKLGILPGGVPPAYGFGTDVQIYDTGALPTNWANHIAGVGYDTDGMSGAQPAGCDIGTGCDAFVGLRYEVTIGAGETEDVVVVHTYGSNTPGGGGAPLDLSLSGSCPGTMTVDVTGLSPNGTVVVGIGTGTDGIILPSGPCAGTMVDISDVRRREEFTADGQGRVRFTKTPQQRACDDFIQAVDLDSCQISSVVPVQ